MDEALRQAERRGDQALARRLRRRATGLVQVGDTIKCVAAHVHVIASLVGETGQVKRTTHPSLDILVIFPDRRFPVPGKATTADDLGWWLEHGEYEVIE